MQLQHAEERAGMAEQRCEEEIAVRVRELEMVTAQISEIRAQWDETVAGAERSKAEMQARLDQLLKVSVIFSQLN
jgi:hypothetical protein